MKTISVIEIKEKEVHKGVSTINIRKIKKPKIFNNLDGDNVKYTECLTDKLREQDIDAGLMTAAGERHYD